MSRSKMVVPGEHLIIRPSSSGGTDVETFESDIYLAEQAIRNTRLLMSKAIRLSWLRALLAEEEKFYDE